MSEQLDDFIRRTINIDEQRETLEGAKELFLELFVEFREEPIGDEIGDDDLLAMAGQIGSASGQADEYSGILSHHDYPQAIVLTLAATAHLLKQLPETDQRLGRFKGITGCTPQEFLDRNY